MAFRLLLAVLVLLLTPAPVHAVTTWKVAVVVYDAVSATCNGRLVEHRVAEIEVSEALADLKTAAAKIDAAGDGALSFTVIRAGTLTKVSPIDAWGCWPSEHDIAWPVGFDSVYVLHPNGLHQWGGLSYTSLVNGSTYATQPIWDGDTDWFDGGYNVGIFLHEWGNGVGGFYRSIFGDTQVPSLYADQSRYRFSDWHADWYGGHLFDTHIGENVGLEPHVWAHGSPTQVGPDPKPCKKPNSQARPCR